MTRERMMVGEDEVQTIEPEGNVIVGTVITESDRFDQDVFAKKADDIKSISGVNPALKKRLTRNVNTVSKKLEGQGDTKSKQLVDEYIDGYMLFNVVIPPHNMEYLAKLFDASSPHAAAVRTKVSNIVGLGYDFVESPKTKDKIESLADGDATQKFRRKLERAKNDLHAWLDRCNKEDEFQETLLKVWTDYETMGNGYLEIGRKANGEIGYIGHCPAINMRVRRNRDGFVQIVNNKATFFRNFGDRDTPDPIGNDSNPNEIIHFKKYSPINTYYGVPEIISAINAVAGNEFSSRYNLDYFEHKAVPRYVVVVKGGNLSMAAEKKIVEFFQGGLKGKNHRTLFIPLPADTDGQKTSFEMKPVEAGAIDASFINYRKSNVTEILMADRVPVSKVGLAEGVSLAASRDADKTFKEQVCRPEQKVLEKKLNRVFAEKTDIFLLKLNELTLTDEDTLSKMDERYLRMKVMLPNEVRARWGWPGIDGGDKPVELKPQDQAEQRAQALRSRTRDSERSANAADTDGEGRQTQGDGRATP